MTTHISRLLLSLGCLTAVLLGTPELGATGVVSTNAAGGVTAQGNDGVGGIERFQRFPAGPSSNNGKGAYTQPGGPQLPPPPPPPATNDLTQDGGRDLGGSLPGSSEAPRLALTANGAGLQVEGGLPGAALTLVVGLAQVDISFKGGLLVPAPDLLLDGLTLGDDGGLVLSLEGLALGIELVVQAWFADPSAPAGLAASNGLAFGGH